MHSEVTGGLLLVLAGCMNGSFALPMKRMPRWAWENIWLAWTVLALLIMPLLLALSSVPHYVQGLGEVSLGSLLFVVVFGAAWGVAQVLFGLSVANIGVALTFSLVLGISAALGAFVPFLRFHRDLLWTSTGVLLFAGLGVLAAGLVFCARAGILREREAGQRTGSVSIRVGLLLAFVSGVLASAMNVGFTYGGQLSSMAALHGASIVGMSAAVWFPLLAGGAVPNVIYTAFLLNRNKTVSRYTVEKTVYLLLTTCMAALWFASTILYGVASRQLGGLGAVLGWPTFMSLVVLVASAIGWMTGEWRGSGTTPLRWQLVGLSMLVIAVFLFAKAVA